MVSPNRLLAYRAYRWQSYSDTCFQSRRFITLSHDPISKPGIDPSILGSDAHFFRDIIPRLPLFAKLFSSLLKGFYRGRKNGWSLHLALVLGVLTSCKGYFNCHRANRVAGGYPASNLIAPPGQIACSIRFAVFTKRSFINSGSSVWMTRIFSSRSQRFGTHNSSFVLNR